MCKNTFFFCLLQVTWLTYKICYQRATRKPDGIHRNYMATLPPFCFGVATDVLAHTLVSRTKTSKTAIYTVKHYIHAGLLKPWSREWSSRSRNASRKLFHRFCQKTAHYPHIRLDLLARPTSFHSRIFVSNEYSPCLHFVRLQEDLPIVACQPDFDNLTNPNSVKFFPSECTVSQTKRISTFNIPNVTRTR